MSPLGGGEQKIADWHLSDFGNLSWSPDGKWLAVDRVMIEQFKEDDERGIYLVPLDGGAPRRITSPKAPAYDKDPVFSADGRLLSYASCTGTACDLFLQPLDSGCTPLGAPRRITRQGLLMGGTAWSRDGKSLICGACLRGDGDSRLWRVDKEGRQKPELLEIAGFQASTPTISPVGDRLVFTRTLNNLDVWRYQVGGRAEPFMVSSLTDDGAQFSPDGSRIAFFSDRSGDGSEIWTAAADGSHPVQLTHGLGLAQAWPRWSPDGKYIAFHSQQEDKQWQIWIVEAAGGLAKRVSPATFQGFNPSWSHDGQSIYFDCEREGQVGVWRVPAVGGDAKQITGNGGRMALESPDRKTLFFTRMGTSALFSRSLENGSEKKVLESIGWDTYAVFDDGIYYIGPIGKTQESGIYFHAFSTIADRLIVKLEGVSDLGLSVSPDRKNFLFSYSGPPNMI